MAHVGVFLPHRSHQSSDNISQDGDSMEVYNTTNLFNLALEVCSQQSLYKECQQKYTEHKEK